MSSLIQPLFSLPGGVWVPHRPGHHGRGGDGEQRHWESEAALRGSTPLLGGGEALLCSATVRPAEGSISQWQGESLGMQACNNL